MAEPPLGEHLYSRHRVRARLVTLTALRVGAGPPAGTSPPGPPVPRDSSGRPFLPGRWIEGTLRAGLERLIRGLPPGTGLRACDPLDNREDSPACAARIRRRIDAAARRQPEARDLRAYDAQLLEHVRREVCILCTLFGSPYLAGRLFIRDLPLSGAAPPAWPVLQPAGEPLPPGTAFDLEALLENADEALYALALEALRRLDDGQILIGGRPGPGLIRVALREVCVERTDARRLLSGEGFEPLDYAAEQARAAATLAALLTPPA